MSFLLFKEKEYNLPPMMSSFYDYFIVDLKTKTEPEYIVHRGLKNKLGIESICGYRIPLKIKREIDFKKSYKITFMMKYSNNKEDVRLMNLSDDLIDDKFEIEGVKYMVFGISDIKVPLLFILNIEVENTIDGKNDTNKI